jgi:pimeloyl-ACP methyl ester carboxylesterase
VKCDTFGRFVIIGMVRALGARSRRSRAGVPISRQVVIVPFTPFALPITWGLGVLSFILLGGGAYLLWLWYVGAVVGATYVAVGCASVIWTLVGRWIVLLFWRRSGEDEPRRTRTGSFQTLQRPDGTRLHVEFSGPADGPTMILTHGWGTDSTEWYYTKRALAECFRLIVWDLPGLGKSGGPLDGNYRLEKMADDLAAVVELAGTRPVLLLGHSIGGMITLTFWRRYSLTLGRRVTGLVLVNTTYTNPVLTTSFSKLWRALQAPLLTPLLYLTIWVSPIVRLMNWLSYLNGFTHIQTALTGFAGHETRGQLDFTAQFTPRCSPAVLARGGLATFAYNEAATLVSIDVPTLVLTGHLDRVLVPEASAYLRDVIPTAELVCLRPAGHMGLLEQHERFNDEVARFGAACFESPGAVTP